MVVTWKLKQANQHIFRFKSWYFWKRKNQRKRERKKKKEASGAAGIKFCLM